MITEPPVMPEFEVYLAEIEAQRARDRSPVIVWLILAGGFVCVILGAVLTIPLPEAGIPLLLVGLRLLALRLPWAARAYAHLRFRWSRAKGWWRAKPGWVRDVVTAITVLIFIVIVKLIWAAL